MRFANDLKPGTAIIYEGKPCFVDSSTTAGTAQRRRSFVIKMHDIITGQNYEHSFGETDRLEEPDLKRREVQLSYKQGKNWIFIDQQDFQEYVVPEDRLKKSKYFLRENETYRLMIIDDVPLGVELPTAFTLEVLETAPPTNSAAGSSQLKEAQLEGGLMVKVPPHVKTGEKIRVSTETNEYLSKA